MAKRSKRHGKGDGGMTTPLDPAACGHLLNVSRETIRRFEDYLALLAEWQKAINLVADSTLSDPWRRHILDSGQLYELLPRKTCRLLDVGSGAGLPGLILAAIAAERDNAPEIHMVESDSKKCAFLRTALRQLDIAATVHEMRAEELTGAPFDVVTARAVAPLDRLFGVTAPLLAPDGVGLFPKGKSVDGEIAAARERWVFQMRKETSRSDLHGAILVVDGLAQREMAAEESGQERNEVRTLASLPIDQISKNSSRKSIKQVKGG